MKNSRQTLKDPTNLTLPIAVYHVLANDAIFFGYIKNRQPNISGFLNHLLLCLSDFREDMHQDFLKYSKGNVEITEEAEKVLYNVYFTKRNFCDDGVIQVPFRVNNNCYDDFLKIHDVKLKIYHTDFSNYVRSLLIEYSIHQFFQREHFVFYRIVKSFQSAIQKQYLCRFYTEIEVFEFVPVSIEMSPVSYRSIVAGITPKHTPLCLPLSEVKNVTVWESALDITDDDYKELHNALIGYYKQEEL